jgi:chromosome segregation protein
MDKGAHFYRCDFQVHTPRDLNWAGARPVTDVERAEYAKGFIKACRIKGLGAVAITDHHDVAFFAYIKKAAEDELDANGNQIPAEKRINVFPGMELTLGVPCQALLIFDSNIPPEFLGQALIKLAIQAAPDGDAKHAQIVRLEHLKDLTALHNTLDELSVLRGRYIVFPNVNSGGQFTIMRAGFLGHYKDMPCVGGYLDHAFDRIDVGDRRILEGKVDAYDFKAIGIFPTSDNRQADFAKLGTNTAWVKWSEPTAEALRQACLAHQTRIAHAEPRSPALLIESLHVSSSKFMGPVDLEFNPQFNCFIGSRGTGKSSILEYLRWGLCDQPVIAAEGEEIPNFQSKRVSLVKNTLAPFTSTVTVNFSLNGVRHTVRRKTDSSELLLKVGNEDFKTVRDQDIRDLLPVQAYSQKQLSSVGVRSEELLRFIEAPILKQLAEIDEQKSDAVESIRGNYAALQRKKGLLNALEKHRLEVASLELQCETLKATISGLKPEESAVLQSHERYLSEFAIVSQWQRDVERFKSIIQKAQSELQSLPKTALLDESLPNNSILNTMQALVDTSFANAKQKLNTIEPVFSESAETWAEFSKLNRQWQATFEAHSAAYLTVQQQATTHQATIKQINEIDARLKELREAIAERQSTLVTYERAELEHNAARKLWISLFVKKAVLIEERCKLLTQLSGGSIRATLKRGGSTRNLSEHLSNFLDRTGIRNRDSKITDLCSIVSKSENPPEAWMTILHELELLIPNPDSTGPAVGPNTPQLIAAGFTSADNEKLSARLTSDDWLELSLIELADEPVFEYKQRDADYISFAEASAGQQATALLRVLLNQEGPPLIIDQPEDDLDNQVIHEIAVEIGAAKARRQLIFSSHNANLVVNGDADLVVACDYRLPGDQSGGRIKCQGAIDGAEIRREITSIMEGGKDAFRLRKEKYGF